MADPKNDADRLTIVKTTLRRKADESMYGKLISDAEISDIAIAVVTDLDAYDNGTVI